MLLEDKSSLRPKKVGFNLDSPKKQDSARLGSSKKFSKRASLKRSATSRINQETIDMYKRAGTFIEYGNDVEPQLDRVEILKIDDKPCLEETDEEDNVYPLSIKYDKKKVRRTK